MLQKKHIPLFFLLLLLFAACRSSDTVTVIQDAPRIGTIPDVEPEDEEEERFMQLRVGVIDPITTMDPLFIDNLSTKRILSVIYDGLFTLDETGGLKKAIATEFSVSDDGKRYRIKVNTDLFFHDSSAFLSGIGRRVQASDIKYAFERTARPNVPPTASRLLMNIEGYELFYKEQRELFESDKRVLEGVSGIRVVDAATVEFRLVEPDPDFLKKLASPYLFIYPREAVVHGLASRPVGTGAYLFREKQENNRVILSRDDSNRAEQRTTRPRINRLEFLYFEEESSLFQQFARNQVDWIPEIGPATSINVTESDLTLTPAYAELYRLQKNDGARITRLHFYDRYRGNLDWLKNAASGFETDNYDFRGSLTSHSPELPDSDISEPDSAYNVVFSKDLTVLELLTEFNETALKPDATLQILDARVPFSRTALYSISSDSFHYPFLITGGGYWLKAESNILQLYHPYVENINRSAVPWRLFIEPIRIRQNDQQSI